VGFRSAVTASRWQNVMDLSENLLKVPDLNQAQLTELYAGREKAFLSTEFHFNLLSDINTQMRHPSFSAEMEPLKQKGLDLIQGKMMKGDLEKTSESSLDSAFQSTAFFRLAQIALEEKDPDLARRYYAKSYNLNPSSELGLRAKELLEQLESAKRVESKTIGVVLPITGKFSAISKKTLRGIQMGLGLADNSYSAFKLAIVDSEGNPENARRGVERLVKEDNVIAIIGSV
jgi:hypothetical protein